MIWKKSVTSLSRRPSNQPEIPVTSKKSQAPFMRNAWPDNKA